MEFFGRVEGNAEGFCCVTLMLGILTWAVYDYRDWVSCGEHP